MEEEEEEEGDDDEEVEGVVVVENAPAADADAADAIIITFVRLDATGTSLILAAVGARNVIGRAVATTGLAAVVFVGEFELKEIQN